MNRGPLNARERELKDRLDEAEETIRQLRGESTKERPKVYRYVRFTPTEATILRCLSSGLLVTGEQLRASVDRASGSIQDCALNSIRVAMNKLRQKLDHVTKLQVAAPISIETTFRQGYSMSAVSIANLRALETEESV